MSPLEIDVSKMGPLRPNSVASLKWVPVRSMLLAKTIYLSVDGTGGVASNGIAAWSFNVIAEFQDGTQAFWWFHVWSCWAF